MQSFITIDMPSLTLYKMQSPYRWRCNHLDLERQMKRIMDGKTYNTDTSTIIVRYEYEDDKGYDTTAQIYQTRGGAFFIVHSWKKPDPVFAEQDIARHYFETTTKEEIERMIARGDSLEILDERALALPPEAEVEAEPMATAYLRLPPALKNRIEAAAKKDDLSLNAWSIRCFERCAQG